jgi:KaiC/GvpD/RAD55 family RecA-like ATPase
MRGVEFNEPGVFMAFEETGDELTENVASLGFDLKGLVAAKKMVLHYVLVLITLSVTRKDAASMIYG